MIETIAAAIQAAAQKSVNAEQELKVEINPKTGTLRAWTVLTIVDSVSDPEREIHIEKARQSMDAPQLGEPFLKEMNPAYLGRIAAQTARQAIAQRIRQFEKTLIQDEYKNQVGDIVSGVVRRHDRMDVYVDLGKAEALLPAKERVPEEEYNQGERVRCLLLKIDTTFRGPELILSRASPQFVRRLLELEVAEIADGTIHVVKIVREPGYRTKVCVHSDSPKVDPVGACVGPRGMRIKNVLRELNGEKIDIIRYFESPEKMLIEAMSPAVPKDIYINEEEKKITFRVSEEDLPIALGRKGQNTRLTARLMDWRLDIQRIQTAVPQFEQRKQSALLGWSAVEGVEESWAQRLIAMGVTTPDAFEGVTAEDLIEAQFSSEEAEQVMNCMKQFREKK